MGIFNFLKLIVKKETKNNSEIENNFSEFALPTIKPEKELFYFYDEIFNTMIKDITQLTKIEGKEILKIIKKCEGGFLNQAGYYNLVWEKYFKGKDWFWNEYEDWNNIFNKLGKFPSTFPQKTNFIPATLEETLNEFKVNDLKNMCIEQKIKNIDKVKKKDLIVLLKMTENVKNNPIVIAKFNEINNRFNYGIYCLFMRTISFRAKSLYDIKRAEKLGIKKFKILHTHEEDKEFVELALKKNPNALHPVFPSDLSIKKSIIEF